MSTLHNYIFLRSWKAASISSSTFLFLETTSPSIPSNLSTSSCSLSTAFSDMSALPSNSFHWASLHDLDLVWIGFFLLEGLVLGTLHRLETAAENFQLFLQFNFLNFTINSSFVNIFQLSLGWSPPRIWPQLPSQWEPIAQAASQGLQLFHLQCCSYSSTLWQPLLPPHFPFQDLLFCC